MCHSGEIRTFELFIPVKRFVHLAFCYRLACLHHSCRLPTFTKRFLYRWRRFSSLFQPSEFYTFVFDFLALEANGSEDIKSLGKTNGFSETLSANHSWKEVCIILPYLEGRNLNCSVVLRNINPLKHNQGERWQNREEGETAKKFREEGEKWV